MSKENSPQAENSGVGQILLVEDNLIAAKVATRVLSQAGYVVMLAVNYQQALELAGQSTYQLILVDYLLPDGDGLELIRELRSRSQFANLPIVMCTASSDEDTLRLAFEAGASDFVSKPVKPTELRTRVASAIRLYENSLLMAREQARDSLEAITSLVAHEINNPISALFHFTRELLDIHAEVPDSKRRLNLMLKGLERIQSLVVDLRLATLNQESQIQWMDVREVVRLACRLLTVRNSGKIWVKDRVSHSTRVLVHPAVTAQALTVLASYLLDAALVHGGGGILLASHLTGEQLELSMTLSLVSSCVPGDSRGHSGDMAGADAQVHKPDRLGPETPRIASARRQLSEFGIQTVLDGSAFPLPLLKIVFPTTDTKQERVTQGEEVKVS